VAAKHIKDCSYKSLKVPFRNCILYYITSQYYRTVAADVLSWVAAELYQIIRLLGAFSA
jgi:hypothetical protein